MICLFLSVTSRWPNLPHATWEEQKLFFKNFFPLVQLYVLTSDSFVSPSMLIAFRILGYVRVLVTNILAVYLYQVIIKC